MPSGPAASAPAKPAIPAPSATIVLLRDRPAGGVEILLIQRHHASKFAAGDHVFPGGKIEVADHPDDVARWCAGLDGDEAARVLGATDGTRTALAHWTGAIREAFEAQSRGEISLRRPTIANLRIFEGAQSVADALASVTGRDIPTIRPRVITDANGKQRALLPGDPGWY